MWLIGLLAGAVVAGMLNSRFVLLGALVGAAIGAVVDRRNRTAAAGSSSMLERIEQLEREVRALRRDLAAPGTQRQAAPDRAEIVKDDVAPPAEITSPPPPLPPAAPEPMPDLPPPRAAAAPRPSPAAAADLENVAPAWWARLMAGNPLAKIGVVLLFFGVASALRLAAEYGLMPVSLRLFLAAAGGVALIVFGIAKVREGARRNFGLAVQGGGFALLYLVAYFMLERYAMIGQGLGFTGFAVLGVACVLLAARQDGPALAVLGLSGAFLAPLLAGGRAETPLPLFTYFALLNAFILAVDWFKAWRVLNIAGFVFTLAVGMSWAMGGYRPEHYLVTQSFLAGFLVVYSAMPVATALLRAPGFAGWRDGMLVFGTPLIGAFLQAQLMRDVPYGLAWSALLAALYYFGLWALLFRRPEPEIRLVERSHLGIAVALLTVSVPLAFGAQITSAFWAAEGTAVLWFGARQRRALAQATGLLMQFAAGLALLAGWQHLGHRLPVANDAVLGAVLLAAAGLVSARLLRALAGAAFVEPALPFVWAMLWWLGTGLDEIQRFAPFDLHAPYGLLFVAATVAGLEGLAQLWAWPQVRAATLLLVAGLWAAAALAVERAGHPFAGMMAVALPAALGLNLALLAQHEKSDAAPFMAVRHLGAWWLLLLVVPAEISWQAQRFAPGVSLWPLLAWGLALAAGTAVPVLGRRRGVWPFAAARGRYVPAGILPPMAGLALLLLWENFNHAGGGSGLTYLPLLNFFDLAQLAGLGALFVAADVLDDVPRPVAQRIAAALAFVWLSALAARIAHHWGGVPFEFHALLQSTLCQALLTLVWTVTAIAAMILAARRASRATWFGGFGLLAVVGAKLLLLDAAGAGTLTWTATLLGVALLVLAAGYFAPLPPAVTNRDDGHKISP